ncbi:MAG: beta-ketoacyl-[acyl-carrier-protein] synthase family protein, partial [Candidatus Omnitrophota bacterium]|nr:beta-ketoacyl-[acyl-carrier-protein] synthase family protein [Candidatus Omnitrophota bacterium]
MGYSRVVITGLGVVSPNSGVGKDSFAQAIFAGTSGIRNITLFDTTPYQAKTAGEVRDFNPQAVLGKEGLRVLDRGTKLLSCAAKTALEDAGITITEENSRAIGLAVGNTLGSLQSICDFDKTAITEGPQYVNPSLFPNTVINAQVSQASIRFKIRGFNVTISNGFSSGLDALIYAANFIRLGRKKIILAGGVEELCEQTFIGFYKAGFLSGSKGEKFESSCPFDRRRNGAVLGEGAAVLVLEELGSALKRGARIVAEIKGDGTFFDGNRIDKYKRGSVGLGQAMRLSLEKASLLPQDIDYLSCGANSTVAGDRLEAGAIEEVFREGPAPGLSCLKSMLGESFSAAGALQAAAAVCAIEKQLIPPTLNYREKDPLCDLGLVTEEARSCRVENALINAFGPGGGNT